MNSPPVDEEEVWSQFRIFIQLIKTEIFFFVPSPLLSPVVGLIFLISGKIFLKSGSFCRRKSEKKRNPEK